MRPERLLADRHADRVAGVDDLRAAGEAVGRVHGDRADALVAEVLLHLADEACSRCPRRPCGATVIALLIVGQLVGEDGLDDDALDLLDPADVLADCSSVLSVALGVSSHGFS